MAENENSPLATTYTTPNKTAKSKPPTKAKRTKKSLGICFTIMPFGGWFQDYYKNIYRPAIEAVGLTPHRADDLYRPSTIVNDIWTYTRQAKLVLADLTGKNPNVFYELGLAHALAKPAILVAVDDVPFDLRSLRVIEYDKNDSGWGKTLRTKIESAILEVLDAPLQAVLPAFLDVEPKKDRLSVSQQEKAMLEIRQELDLLRSQIRRSDLEPRINPSISRVEAEKRLSDYIRRGLSRSFILRRLESLGFPREWIIAEMERRESLPVQPILIPEMGNKIVTSKKKTQKRSAAKQTTRVKKTGGKKKSS